VTPSSWLSALALGVACVSGAACAGSPAAPTEDQGSLSLSPAILAPELAFCADEINRYRRTVGLLPLARSQDLEAFAAFAAEADGIVHLPHAYFHATDGAGVSRAETEILWWRGFSIRNVIREGLAQMWQVGPGGEHYDIIAGDYVEIGCGIFSLGGEVTVTQDFR
jgi:hypothetical protein